jgi:hypothetical protein
LPDISDDAACSDDSRPIYTLQNMQSAALIQTECENESCSDFSIGSEASNLSILSADFPLFDELSSDDDDDDDDKGQMNELDIIGTLQQWFLKSKASLTDLDHLLTSLKPFHPSLPLSHKTLLKTNAQQYSIKPFPNGEFVYFGIECSLKYFSHFYHLSQISDIKLHVNIDGLPLFKSSDRGFWPILVMDRRIMKEPVLIGSYFGEGKPDASLFLADFISEVNRLEKVTIQGQDFPISICLFVADLPAKAFIKQTKGHTGFHSCNFCVVKGKSGRSVYFTQTNCLLRTDESFRQQHDPGHHLSTSPLLALDIDLVNAFPIDYMHGSCLGVVKRMLMFLIKPKSYSKGKLHYSEVKKISDLLVWYEKDIPAEFSRKPRPLTYIKRFKATEFRQILLYTSLVIFSRLPRVFVLFKTLLVSHYILLDASLSSQCNLVEYAGSLLKYFITVSSKYFGKEFVSMNVHCLQHMHAQVFLSNCIHAA